MVNDFFLGLIVGVVVGLISGILLADSYELARDAIRDLKKDRPPVTRVGMFWIVVTFAMAQVLVGSFVAYNGYRDGEFQKCVFQYNQQFGESYRAISEANRQATDARFKWEKLVPKSFGDQEDFSIVERKKFRKKYLNYVKQMGQLVEEREENPYPPLPDVLCGKP